MKKFSMFVMMFLLSFSAQAGEWKTVSGNLAKFKKLGTENRVTAYYGRVYSDRRDGILRGYAHTFYVVGPGLQGEFVCISDKNNPGSFKYRYGNTIFEYIISGTCMHKWTLNIVLKLRLITKK